MNSHHQATRNNCRSCDNPHLWPVTDLGQQRLSDFSPDPDYQPPAYPLVMMLCMNCGLLQLNCTVPRDQMYHGRYSFKSGTSETIRADLESVVQTALLHAPQYPYKRQLNWLDIASNDGTLLASVPNSYYRVGVDPLKQFASEAIERPNGANQIVVDYFNPAYFARGQFDVVTSISMFYDLDDPNQFVEGVREVLAPDGVWVIQQNYSLSMLKDTVFDNICHEHVTYFGLRTLQSLLDRHGLVVTHAGLSPVNGGCLRTIVKHRGFGEPGVSVQAQLALERQAGLRNPTVWEQFGDRSIDRLTELHAHLYKLREQNQRTYAYGASTRGGTILQAAGLGVAELPYAVERQEAKVGKIWSAVGIPIISEQQARDEHPDAMLVSPWFMRDQIVTREQQYLQRGGRLIFPLPELQVVGQGAWQ